MTCIYPSPTALVTDHLTPARHGLDWLQRINTLGLGFADRVYKDWRCLKPCARDPIPHASSIQMIGRRSSKTKRGAAVPCIDRASLTKIKCR